MKIIDIDQGTPEWLEFRKSGIGASDISAIIGINPWKKSIDVYNDKKGLSAPLVANDAMLRGSFYEPEAREKHNKVNDYNFVPVVVQHDEYPFFFASLDGYCKDTNQILEIKVPTSSKLMALASVEKIPDYYETQVQWQLFVSNAESAIFAVYCPETGEMVENIIERDEERIEHLKMCGFDFWESIDSNCPPVNPQSHINLEFPNHIDIFDRYKKLDSEIKLLKDKIKYLDTELSILKPLILDLGDGGNWMAHGVKITDINGRCTYDYKKMEQDGINIEKYKKQGKPYYKFEVMNES